MSNEDLEFEAAELEPSMELYCMMVQYKIARRSHEGNLEEPDIGTYDKFVENFNWYKRNDPDELIMKIGAWHRTQEKGYEQHRRESRADIREVLIPIVRKIRQSMRRKGGR